VKRSSQPTTAQRGYGGAWQELRRVVLARDGWTCYRCGGLADCVDHVQPLSKGGASGFDNCRAIWRPCNTAKMHEDNPHVGTSWRRATKRTTLRWPTTRSAPTGALADAAVNESVR
jgi:5-methylcytosine-specific restriction endonuclease McrA